MQVRFRPSSRSPLPPVSLQLISARVPLRILWRSEPAIKEKPWESRLVRVDPGIGGHAGRNAREFFHIHSAAADSKGNLFLGEVNNGQRYYRYAFKGMEQAPAR